MEADAPESETDGAEACGRVEQSPRWSKAEAHG